MSDTSRDSAPYIFLSYASSDRARALHLADLLEASRVAVWIDRKSIAGGTSWSAEIVRGIEQCAALIVLLSEAAVASPNVQQEIQLAWESRKPILPVLLANVQLPQAMRYALAGRQWIEALDRPDEAVLPLIARAFESQVSGVGIRVSGDGGRGGALTPASSPARTNLTPSPSPSAPGEGSSSPSTPDTRYPTPPSPHNLPAEVTSFVGRERELAEVRSLLVVTRLLTLTGAGGSGKTRLALKLAETVMSDYPDGVWLTELAPLADPALVPYAVASALGVRETPGRDVFTVVHEFLRPRRILLVVDNCEHLIEASATLIGTLVRGCPHLKVVATSREILGVPGETAWRVPSLPAPDPRVLPRSIDELMAVVAGADAARLFVERAQQALPGFQLDATNAASVAQICHRLDGIPLAIELAVARLRTLTVEQLASRLDNRFRMLTGGSRTALRRQQTLRALVDWSHDLLSEREQRLFRRLAVFAGGWTLEAAEAVCVDEGVGDRVSGVGGGTAPHPSPRPEGEGIPRLTPDTRHLTPVLAADVLDLLGALVDKSLVVVDNGAGGMERFRLLETLREYAMEKLVAGGESEAIHQRHAEYYQALASATPLHRLQDPVRLKLVVEYDNMRAGLRWLADAGDWERCLRLIGTLGSEWVLHGYLSETVPWIEFVLRHKDQVTAAVRSLSLHAVGDLAFGQGDFATSIAAFEECAIVCRDLGDQRLLAQTLIDVGTTLRDQDELAPAAQALNEAMSASRLVGEPTLLGSALFQSGLLARQMGDLEHAESLLTELLTSLPDAQTHGTIRGAVLYNLGLVAEDRGQLARARDLYGQGITLLRRGEYFWLLPFVLEGYATLEWHHGNAERALIFAGAAVAVRERNGNPIPPAMKPRLDAAVAPARAQLGEPAASAAWEKGQAMSLDRAIAYALGEE